MSISTKDVNVGSGKPRKNIEPGDRYVKINSIVIEKPKWQTADPNERFIYFNVETEPVGGDFEGFFFDKDHPELGRHAGQVAKVSVSKYTFKDYESPDGVQIKMVDKVVQFLAGFCKELDIMDWWLSIDGKFDTVEDIIFALNEHKPFKDKYVYMCIAGKEWQNGEYINYNLYLPRYSRAAGSPYSMNEDNVIKFNVTDHIDKLKKDEPVSSFSAAGATSETPGASTGSKFSMED